MILHMYICMHEVGAMKQRVHFQGHTYHRYKRGVAARDAILKPLSSVRPFFYQLPMICI